MAVLMEMFSVFLIIQTFALNTVLAQQYIVQNLPCQPQIKNAPYSQQTPPLINSLLSTYSSNMPIGDKLNAIAAVIQKLPPKNPGIAHKRVYMAEALKKTALESLLFAANACKCSQKAEPGRIPLPNPQMSVGNEVFANRAVNVRYI